MVWKTPLEYLRSIANDPDRPGWLRVRARMLIALCDPELAKHRKDLEECIRKELEQRIREGSSGGFMGSLISV
jgi:hypothetical protein